MNWPWQNVVEEKECHATSVQHDHEFANDDLNHDEFIMTRNNNEIMDEDMSTIIQGEDDEEEKNVIEPPPGIHKLECQFHELFELFEDPEFSRSLGALLVDFELPNYPRKSCYAR